MQQALQAAEHEEPLETTNVSCVLACPGVRPPTAWRSPGSRAGKTYSVDYDGREDGGCDSRPVCGILLAANEFGMVTLEEQAEDGQNNDRKYRDHKAKVPKRQQRPWFPTMQPGGDVTHQDQACTALTTGFIFGSGSKRCARQGRGVLFLNKRRNSSRELSLESSSASENHRRASRIGGWDGWWLVLQAAAFR